MPELPEVETTRRGIEPHIINRKVVDIHIRQRQLRWPITRGLAGKVAHQTLISTDRRAKYLLLNFQQGSLIIHLGMSGSLRVLNSASTEPPGKHDHVDILFDNGKLLRFHDPRRFGAILWAQSPPQTHKLLNRLGPEPLSDEFNAKVLGEKCSSKKTAIKNVIMNQQTVVGVGNIYASEALFLSGIRPGRAAGRVTGPQLARLTDNIKRVLNNAIQQGGTTLKDFSSPDGKPGYFKQSLHVYGRENQPCTQCHTLVKKIIIGQRSSYYCPVCQK